MQMWKFNEFHRLIKIMFASDCIPLLGQHHQVVKLSTSHRVPPVRVSCHAPRFLAHWPTRSPKTNEELRRFWSLEWLQGPPFTHVHTKQDGRVSQCDTWWHTCFCWPSQTKWTTLNDQMMPWHGMASKLALNASCSSERSFPSATVWQRWFKLPNCVPGTGNF